MALGGISPSAAGSSPQGSPRQRAARQRPQLRYVLEANAPLICLYDDQRESCLSLYELAPNCIAEGTPLSVSSEGCVTKRVRLLRWEADWRPYCRYARYHVLHGREAAEELLVGTFGLAPAGELDDLIPAVNADAAPLAGTDAPAGGHAAFVAAAEAEVLSIVREPTERMDGAVRLSRDAMLALEQLRRCAPVGDASWSCRQLLPTQPLAQQAWQFISSYGRQAPLGPMRFGGMRLALVAVPLGGPTTRRAAESRVAHWLNHGGEYDPTLRVVEQVAVGTLNGDVPTLVGKGTLHPWETALQRIFPGQRDWARVGGLLDWVAGWDSAAPQVPAPPALFPAGPAAGQSPPPPQRSAGAAARCNGGAFSPAEPHGLDAFPESARSDEALAPPPRGASAAPDGGAAARILGAAALSVVAAVLLLAALQELQRASEAWDAAAAAQPSAARLAHAMLLGLSAGAAAAALLPLTARCAAPCSSCPAAPLEHYRRRQQQQQPQQGGCAVEQRLLAGSAIGHAAAAAVRVADQSLAAAAVTAGAAAAAAGWWALREVWAARTAARRVAPD